MEYDTTDSDEFNNVKVIAVRVIKKHSERETEN